MFFSETYHFRHRGLKRMDDSSNREPELKEEPLVCCRKLNLSLAFYLKASEVWCWVVGFISQKESRNTRKDSIKDFFSVDSPRMEKDKSVSKRSACFACLSVQLHRTLCWITLNIFLPGVYPRLIRCRKHQLQILGDSGWLLWLWVSSRIFGLYLRTTHLNQIQNRGRIWILIEDSRLYCHSFLL